MVALEIYYTLLFMSYSLTCYTKNHHHLPSKFYDAINAAMGSCLWNSLVLPHVPSSRGRWSSEDLKMAPAEEGWIRVL